MGVKYTECALNDGHCCRSREKAAPEIQTRSDLPGLCLGVLQVELFTVLRKKHVFLALDNSLKR